ncbi:MAG: hypothetical protein K1X51_04875 [Rhodospirillaceae bacterium]|nr:hypothetical protein [Rhodospirillaceae bacterium]
MTVVAQFAISIAPIDNQYRAERIQDIMFTALAVLAVIVAGLGLFGLAAFKVARAKPILALRYE